MPSEGEAIRAAFAGYDGRVNVFVTGNAHSAASLMIMGADNIEMSAGSLMLIHDPSQMARGNPEQLAAASVELGLVADAYAGVYAARVGITVDEARAIMKAETMLSAPAAVEAGFADAVTASPQKDNAPATMSRADALSRVAAAMQRAQEAQMKFEAAPASLDDGASQTPGQEAIETAGKVTTMTKTTATLAAAATALAAGAISDAPAADVVMSATDAVAADRARVKGIREAAAPFMSHVGQAELDRMIDDGTSVDDANRVIMAAAASGQPRTSRVEITRDERETKRIGMTAAAVAQMLHSDPSDDRARPFMDMSFVDMAADLTGSARPRTTGGRAEILMNAGHSTSDFPLILANAFNMVIEDAYSLVTPTFTEFSREKTFNDFRAHDIVRPDNFPTLNKVGENGEIKFGTFGESKETMALASYATGLSISRQLMVNDTFNGIAEVIMNAANIVPDFEEATFWKMMLSNPKLSDGKAIFHADHNNIAATGAINTVNVGEGRKAMRSHKLADGRAISGNFPAVLIVGPERETEAEQFLAPVLAAEQINVNPLAKRLRLVVTEQITDDKWFLTVDKSRPSHAFKHGYLDGYRAPRVRVDDPFGTQGTALSIEHDFACGGVGYMGAYRRG